MIIGSLSIWKELKKYARQLICPFMHIFFTVSYWGQNLSPSVAKVFYRTKQLYSLKSKLEFFFESGMKFNLYQILTWICS